MGHRYQTFRWAETQMNCFFFPQTETPFYQVSDSLFHQTQVPNLYFICPPSLDSDALLLKTQKSSFTRSRCPYSLDSDALLYFHYTWSLVLLHYFTSLRCPPPLYCRLMCPSPLFWQNQISSSIILQTHMSFSIISVESYVLLHYSPDSDVLLHYSPDSDALLHYSPDSDAFLPPAPLQTPLPRALSLHCVPLLAASSSTCNQFGLSFFIRISTCELNSCVTVLK